MRETEAALLIHSLFCWNRGILCNLSPICAYDGNDQSRVNNRRRRRRADLTTKLVEVRLDFPPGVEEHPALLCANGDHAVFMHGDARHLGVKLGHRHALQIGGNGL